MGTAAPRRRHPTLLGVCTLDKCHELDRVRAAGPTDRELPAVPEAMSRQIRGAWGVASRCGAPQTPVVFTAFSFV